MKGIELPVNALIIVILAVLVLLGILALYAGVWSPSSGGIILESAKNNGCHMLASMGCNAADTNIITVNYDASGNGNIGPEDTLLELCIKKYFKLTEEDCKNLCGCNMNGGGSGGSGGGAGCPPGATCITAGDCPPGCTRCIAGECS